MSCTEIPITRKTGHKQIPFWQLKLPVYIYGPCGLGYILTYF